MKILFLTQWFQPEPFFKGLPFVRALRDKGHDVEVLTGFPNYPGGKIYSGYKVRIYKRDKMEDITIHRVLLYPSHDKSALRRILNYLSFSLSSLLLAPWIIRKPDIIYVYNLVTLGPTAFLLRLIYGSKVIIDVQDLWPESVVNSKMLGDKTPFSLLNLISSWIYRKADRLTVLSPGFKQALTVRGVSPDKMDVIYNWCDESWMDEVSSGQPQEKPSKNAGKFIILFAGTMGLVQGLDTVLDCAMICRNVLPEVKFILVGGGVDCLRLQQRSVEMGLENVVFLPWRPIDEIGKLYAGADALLVHLKDDPLFRITIPSKTQTGLFAGKPIIMAMCGDAAELVLKAQGGIVCNPDDPQEMMKAIKSIYEMPEIKRQKMGEAGHRYYMNYLSFNQGVEKFEKIMMSLSEKES